jgi:hypothetical protein
VQKHLVFKFVQCFYFCKKNSPNFLRVLQKNLHSIENKKGNIKTLLIYESAKTIINGKIVFHWIYFYFHGLSGP